MAKVTRTPRARRSPDEARALILAAAERVFAARGPDAVGLKEVAAEAGVSHALVTHYFGTYEGLVEATLEAQSLSLNRELVARVASSPDEGPAAWIAHAFATLGSRGHGRLLAWAFLSGRTDRSDFFVHRERGLATIADVLESWAAAQGRTLDREQLEIDLLLTVTAALGYSIGRSVLWGGVGREATADRDRRVAERFASLLLGANPSLARPAPASPVAPGSPPGQVRANAARPGRSRGR